MTMTLEDFKPDLVDQIIPFRSFKPLQDPREHRLKLVKRLGGGTYGDVYLAIEQLPEGESGQGECFAVKYYMDEARNVMDEGLSCTTIREFSVLSSCGNHPNLVRMCYLFVDQLPRLAEHINQQRKLWAERQVEAATSSTRSQLQRDLQAQLEQGDLKPNQVFVLAAYELCKGGDLKKLLAKHKQDQTQDGVSPLWGLPLRRTKMLAFQMLNGLAFLHNEKMCHRDLKPDNLMLTSEDEDCVLKIGDLGLCRGFRANAGEVTPTVCTIYYRPLEVLLGKMNVDGGRGQAISGAHYGLASDIWGAGCIIAEMIRGIPLFKGTQEFEVLIRITKILGTPTQSEWTNCHALQHYPFRNRCESHFFSEHDKRQNLNAVLYGKLDLDGLDLLARMLDYNPHSRISAQEALSHRWFTDVAFGQLDGLGVYNWFVDVLKFRLGEKTFEAMERHTPRCLTTTKVSHILCQKGYNGAVVQRIDRVFGEVGGFHESEQCAHWKQVVAAEQLAFLKATCHQDENKPRRANSRISPYEAAPSGNVTDASVMPVQGHTVQQSKQAVQWQGPSTIERPKGAQLSEGMRVTPFLFSRISESDTQIMRTTQAHQNSDASVGASTNALTDPVICSDRQRPNQTGES